MILLASSCLTAFSQGHTIASQSQDSLNNARSRTAGKVLETMYSQDKVIAYQDSIITHQQKQIDSCENNAVVQEKAAQDTKFLLNNCEQDGMNMDKNYRKDIKNIKRAYKIKDVILSIETPILLGISAYLYIRH